MDRNDGGQGGGGSKWSTALTVTGIGCVVMLLLGSLLSTYVSYHSTKRMFGCFNQVVLSAQISPRAKELGYDFAESLHEQDFDRAYGYLGDDLRDKISRDEFESEFDDLSIGFASSRPFPVYDVRSLESGERDGTTLRRRSITTKFVGPRSDAVLILNAVVEISVDEDDEIVDGRIIDWDTAPHTRALEEDPAAKVAIDFYDKVRRGRVNHAIQVVAGKSPLRGGSNNEVDRSRVVDLTLGDSGLRTATVDSVYPKDQELVGVLLRVGSDEPERMVEISIVNERRVFDISQVDEVDSDNEVVDEGNGSLH